MKALIVIQEYPERITEEANIESWKEGLELSPLKSFIIEYGVKDYVFYSFHGVILEMDVEIHSLIMSEYANLDAEEKFAELLKLTKWDEGIEANKGG